MRVLHVIPSLSARIGGPAVSVVEASLALRAQGVESVIFATDSAEPPTCRKPSRVTAADLPDGAGQLDVRLLPVRWPYRLAYSPALRQALKSEVARCDVIHIHMLFLHPPFAAYRETVRSGVPYVVSPCGALDPHLRRRSRAVKAVNNLLWHRAMLDRAAAIHYKTPEEAQLAAGLGFAAPTGVAPNGIRWDRFQTLPPAERFRWRYLGGDEGPVVLYLGRLSHKKGLDILVRAFALVHGSTPDAWLVIAGPDDEGLTKPLENLARREGVADRVVFTGMLRGDDKLAALAAASVWALPSHTENFGVAVVEAMAAGLATVISPAVNLSSAVQSADAGVVADLTPGAFASAIAALLRDEARRDTLGERARVFARRYDWSAVAPRWAEMYERAILPGGDARASALRLEDARAR